MSHLIASYGYWAVFALVGLESLGIPLPGETALIIAGAYAGSTHNLSAWAVFAVASAAAIIGDNAGFWIGRKGGYRLARAYGPRIRLDEGKLKIARYLFDTYGPKVVFFGRFTAVLRTYAAFLAGASRMSWRRFLPANAAADRVGRGSTRSRRTSRATRCAACPAPSAWSSPWWGCWPSWRWDWSSAGRCAGSPPAPRPPIPARSTN